MPLFLATLFPGLLLLGIGGLLLGKQKVVTQLRSILRSKTLTLLTLIAAMAWLLWHVAHLGQADFGQYKSILMVGFATIALLSWFFLPDFLLVRMGSILTLLVSWVLLKAAYMEWDYPSRLWMVALVYCCVVLALYFAVVPYRMRDFLDWLIAKQLRVRATGLLFSLYGGLLCGVAFSY